jgi:hypothetical protein
VRFIAVRLNRIRRQIAATRRQTSGDSCQRGINYMPLDPMIARRRQRTLHARERLMTGRRSSTMLELETDNVIHMPTSIHTTAPEAAKTLEQAWQRRREELANWQPSGGWLADQRKARPLARARVSAR